MCESIPKAPLEFLSLCATYIFPKNNYNKIKAEIINCINKNKYNHNFDGNYNIEVYNQYTKCLISIFSHTNDEILIEFNRKSGCGLQYGKMYNTIVNSIKPNISTFHTFKNYNF